MFRTAATRSGLVRRLAMKGQLQAASPRRFSTVPPDMLRNWYNTFGKSTAMYSSWLVMVIVIGEFATGKMTDAFWTANNYGKTFTTVDWSKFDQFEDEEEEEEEEDDDDDDDE